MYYVIVNFIRYIEKKLDENVKNLECVESKFARIAVHKGMRRSADMGEEPSFVFRLQTVYHFSMQIGFLSTAIFTKKQTGY